MPFGLAAVLLALCFAISLCTAVYSPLPLLGLLGIGLGALVFFFPAYGLMAVFTLFLIQLSPAYLKYGVFARSITAADVIGLLVVFGWVRQELSVGRAPDRGLQIGGTLRSSHNAAMAAVGVYLLWQIVSVLWSTAPLTSDEAAIRGSGEAFALFALALLMLRTEKLARRAAGLYASTACVLAAYTIINFSSLGGFASATAQAALNSANYRGGLPDSANANELSIILACAPAFGFLAAAKMRKRVRYLLSAAPLPLVALAIAILSSRETYVAIGVAVLVSVLVTRTFRYRLTVAVVLAVAGVAVFLALNANSLPVWVTHRFTTADVGTLGARAPFWIIALHLFAANPLGGLGFAGFEQVIPNYHVNAYLGVSATHNQYVNALVDSGIIGFVLLLVMLVTLARTVLRQGIQRPALVVNFVVVVVDMMAADLLQPHFAWVILALVAACALSGAETTVDLQPERGNADSGRHDTASMGARIPTAPVSAWSHRGLP